MKNSRVRALTDTAVTAALCVLFITIMIYVPPLSLPMSLVIGIPLMYVCCKRGWKYGVFAVICAAAISFVLVGNILSIALIMLTYAIPGFVFGVCASKGCKFMVSVAVSAIAVIVGFVAELMILNGGGDGIQNILTEAADSMTQMLNTAVSQTGAIPEDEARVLINQAVTQSINMFRLYIPSVVIIAAVIYSYCVSMLGVFILKRIRVKDVDYTRFYMIRASKGMCFVTAILLVVTSFTKSDGLYMAALENMAFMSVLAIAVCGLSVIDYKFRKSIPSGYIRTIIYTIIFFAGALFSTLIFMVLVVLGYTDGILGRRTADNIGDDKYGKK